MYNMEILVFGYKLNLGILILIGVVFLILVGHTICGTCNVPKIMEGFKMKRSKNKNKANTSVASVASIVALDRVAQAEAQAEVEALAKAQAQAEAEARAQAEAEAQAQAARAKVAAEDAAFIQEVNKIINIPPEEEARLLRIPPQERDAFLKRVAQGKAQEDERKAQEKAREAENAALLAKNMAAQEAFFKESSKIMGWSRDDPNVVQWEGRNRGLPPDKKAEVLIRLSKQKAQKEGFTGSNTSSWSAQNMTLVQGHSLPEDETLMFFANTKFAPECCPGSYSNSEGCACLTANKFNFLKLRGNNNVPYSEY